MHVIHIRIDNMHDGQQRVKYSKAMADGVKNANDIFNMYTKNGCGRITLDGWSAKYSE